MDALDKTHLEAVLGVVQHIGILGLKATGEFNTRQNALSLDKIFSPENLGDPKRRRESLEKINSVESLLAAYQRIYADLFVQFSIETATASMLLPEERRKESIDSLIGTIQKNLNEQAYFYSLRESWINRCRELIALMESEGVETDGSQLMFERKEGIATMATITQEIDRVAAAESALAQLRVQRIQQGANFLGVVIRRALAIS